MPGVERFLKPLDTRHGFEQSAHSDPQRAAWIFEVADKFSLLGVDADDGIAPTLKAVSQVSVSAADRETAAEKPRPIVRRTHRSGDLTKDKSPGGFLFDPNNNRVI